MNSYDTKSQERSEITAAVEDEKRTGDQSAIRFRDNRPESSLQKQIQTIADESPRTKKIAQLAALIINSPHHDQRSVKPSLQMKSGTTSQMMHKHHSSNLTIQLLTEKTKISHTWGRYSAENDDALEKHLKKPEVNDDTKVGIAMRAELVPEDPVVGSAPARKNSPLYAPLWKSNRIVRGHLLNHDLGGIGMPENLFPITSAANSDHSKRVEANVKNELAKANEHNTKDKIEKQWVQYNVEVRPPTNQTEFVCRWSRRYAKDDKPVDETPPKPVRIPSSFTMNTEDRKNNWHGAGAGTKLPSWTHKAAYKKGDETKHTDPQSGRIIINNNEASQAPNTPVVAATQSSGLSGTNEAKKSASVPASTAATAPKIASGTIGSSNKAPTALVVPSKDPIGSSAEVVAPAAPKIPLVAATQSSGPSGTNEVKKSASVPASTAATAPKIASGAIVSSNKASTAPVAPSTDPIGSSAEVVAPAAPKIPLVAAPASSDLSFKNAAEINASTAPSNSQPAVAAASSNTNIATPVIAQEDKKPEDSVQLTAVEYIQEKIAKLFAHRHYMGFSEALEEHNLAEAFHRELYSHLVDVLIGQYGEERIFDDIPLKTRGSFKKDHGRNFSDKFREIKESFEAEFPQLTSRA